MEAKRTNPFSLGALQAGAKGLSATPEPKQDAKRAGMVEEENAELREHLISIWDKHDGDIRSVFEELKEDPGKALKVRERERKGKGVVVYYNLREERGGLYKDAFASLL